MLDASRAGLTRRRLLLTGAWAAAGALWPRPLASAAGRRLRRRVDVVIVGAGLAGLTAARDLRRHRVSVVVLEARHRVGGRTLGVSIGDGEHVEVGGQWIGPGQNRIASLARSLGVHTFKTYDQGQYVLEYMGARSLFRGLVPPVPPADQAEFLTAFAELEALAKKVPVRYPMRAPRAAHRDARSFEAWKRDTLTTPGARFLIDLIARSVFAAEPADLSFLHVLFYASAAGEGSGTGLTLLTSTPGGAQESRFVGGSQRVSLKLAKRLGDAVVLGAAVRRIERHGGRGVRVLSDRGTFTGQRVIVAMSPLMAGHIRYEPALPVRRAALQRHMPNGSVIKVNALYERPFWRDAGLSGYAFGDRGPVELVYDNSPPDGGPGVLVGFIAGDAARAWRRRPAAERRAAALQALGRYFGPPATAPARYLEKDWTRDRWTRGCYGGYFRPHGWTRYGRALRRPVGRIHWAGSETATEWMGYMDGAVQSGHRVAREVLRAL